MSVAFALLTGCATTDDLADEPEPTYIAETGDAALAAPTVAAAIAASEGTSKRETDETVRIDRPKNGLTEVVVEAKADDRHEVIRDLVVEARNLLRKVELQYVFTGKGRRETLRGRPVAFALWSETTQSWSIAHVEIPRPPVRWRPGGRPMPFVLRAPGITAKHVKGTGAERLMFAFSKGDEPLKVYGRKFPVFDSKLIAKRRWRAVAETAKPIVYLPFTADTLDPRFVTDGRDYLRATAKRAIDELRRAAVPSSAFPGQLLADVVPAEVIMTLAVIEQTDDADFRRTQLQAFEEVLSQYGLKREEAYRFSISRAKAIGPMQFTNRRGNGTYALVVRRCPGARLDPNFERGATDLLNAMKAAICLFDIELKQMPASIRDAYWDNKTVLGIFPVAAYNGGPRNVTRLRRVLDRMGVDIAALRAPGVVDKSTAVPCPCVWREGPGGPVPVTIPSYNNENRWYIEKYQSIINLLGERS
ncbi:MAG: hypothetical protein ACO29T_00710 [Steroidobacteraceae bacterium]